METRYIFVHRLYYTLNDRAMTRKNGQPYDLSLSRDQNPTEIDHYVKI